MVPKIGRPGLSAAVRVDTPIGAIYDNSLVLLGYDGPLQGTAGQSVRATLCWRAAAPISADQTLFLEVVVF